MKDRNNKSIVKGIFAGMVSGLVAAWVMNLFQQELSAIVGDERRSHGAQSQQTGSPQHGAASYLSKHGAEDPDDDAAERTASAVSLGLANVRLSEKQKDVGGTLFHYAFGATTGALYGAAAELVPTVKMGYGLPFGAAVWLIADEAVVPVLGLSKLPNEYPASTHAYALASHLVYGLAADAVLTGLRPNGEEDSSNRRGR